MSYVYIYLYTTHLTLPLRPWKKKWPQTIEVAKEKRVAYNVEWRTREVNRHRCCCEERFSLAATTSLTFVFGSLRWFKYTVVDFSRQRKPLKLIKACWGRIARPAMVILLEDTQFQRLRWSMYISMFVHCVDTIIDNTSMFVWSTPAISCLTFQLLHAIAWYTFFGQGAEKQMKGHQVTAKTKVVLGNLPAGRGSSVGMFFWNTTPCMVNLWWFMYIYVYLCVKLTSGILRVISCENGWEKKPPPLRLLCFRVGARVAGAGNDDDQAGEACLFP